MAARSATVTNLRFRMAEVGTGRTRTINMQITFDNAVDDWTVTIPAISSDQFDLLMRQFDLYRVEDQPVRDLVTTKVLNILLSPP